MKLRKLLSMALALCLCASLMVPMSSAALVVPDPVEVQFGGFTATKTGNTYKVEKLQAWTSTESFADLMVGRTLTNATNLRFVCELTFSGLTINWTDNLLTGITVEETNANHVFTPADNNGVTRVPNTNTLQQTFKFSDAVISGWGSITKEALTTTITFSASPSNFTVSNVNNPEVTATVKAVLGNSEWTVAEGSSSMTITDAQTGDVSGKIYSHVKKDTTVSLCSGDTVVVGPLTIAGADMAYDSQAEDAKKYSVDFAFADVPDGIYNLVAEQVIDADHTLTITKMIVLPNDLTSGDKYDIEMPAGDYSSVVAVEPGTPPIIVGGLENVAKDEGETEIATAPTASVIVIMTVEKVDDTTTDPDALTGINEIDSIKPANAQTNYYEIDIQKLKEVSGFTTSTDIHDTSPYIITILIPYNMLGKSASRVNMWSYHKGDPTATPLIGDGLMQDGHFFVDTANNVIRLYATSFSTYAISYTPTGSDSSDSSDSSSSTIKDPTSTSYKDCTRGGSCPMDDFSDVSPKAWYHDGVHWALESGVMIGGDDGLFQPAVSTTRAMVAVMLWRLEGSPKADTAIPYGDVGAKQWFADGVRWATKAGVINGYSNGNFGPNDPVTREQLAAMLYRYAQYKNVSVSAGSNASLSGYVDADSVSSYALPAMKWATAVGIVNGLDDENSIRVLAPKDESQRSVVATMFMRYYTQIIK